MHLLLAPETFFLMLKTLAPQGQGSNFYFEVLCAIYFPLGKRFLCDKNENCLMLKDVFLNTCSNRMVPICLFLKGNDICKATLLRMPCNFVFLLHLTASLATVSVNFVIVRLNVSLIVLGEYL